MLFALVSEIGLSATERFELAEQILQREITTYKYLSAHEASRLIDAMRGFQLISTLNAQKAR